MNAIVGRDYCIRHPGQILQLFGPAVLLGMLLGRTESLLERLLAHHQAHGFPLPGEIGRSYRLAELIERRVARVYASLELRFVANPPVRTLFGELRAEEEEHARLMAFCRYQVALHSALRFTPRLRDPEVRSLLKRLKALEKMADRLTLDEALTLTDDLEQGEINIIFERLLSQAAQEETRFFEGRMADAGNHAISVHARIKALRSELAQG